MGNILEVIKELFDPLVLVVFICLGIFALLRDTPDLRKMKLLKEAHFYTILSWACISFYFMLLVVVMLA
jgi:hypothetical protein